ncbi:NAD(P) transhydrogenase subunit alpha [Wohlfahrtiimonas chitiniclastica]|uniref:NAD(P) transhydrogenase subunit alpha n=1 Tax=Wohlfahrtiimonas chitiniclastica TaxID=400946 RepID=UPI000374C9E9|nr:NAD(P) transhydrogenase subunit alpha [Wohlfahrtiimonas chitiniclastica]MBS7815473.1 NAD(P) transhydrogenase subunit alpha [Wohlfahrtiimonas chitiniclastica]MBS7838914.1 NAD(P) transhydrogenase subunit alpha [Wohlfahrtiimonas chitiniclastica]OYQ74204.1 NAD(P) transhydrogenase subunit alpha [Wohlfahrtiimonas chitiniclastica]
MTQNIIVLKECAAQEKRVALDPLVAKRFSDLGFSVTVTPNAGKQAFFPDESYQDVAVKAPTFSENDIVLCVQSPSLDTIEALAPNSILVGLLNPYQNADVVKALQAKNITSFAMELIPRITRAQSMDALSSQATIVGYEGVLMAASLSPRLFPMLTTAAGTIRPAKVVVIGAGVAGLQAIGTARRLGAQVEAYDIRPDAKEQVESLGAKLIDTGVNAAGEGGYARELTEEEVAMQAAALKKHLSKAHAVISTAAIPGRKAPVIITEDMVEEMPAGSVIIDLAAETGGNCALTQVGKIVQYNNVTISGPVNVASRAALHASEMYAKNIFNLLSPFMAEGQLTLDYDDEVIAQCLLTKDGKIVHERVRQTLEK